MACHYVPGGRPNFQGALAMRLAIRIALSFVSLTFSPQLAFAQQSDDAAQNAKIARLIEQLDADRYEVREQASRQLGDIGMPALAALRHARQHASTEVRRRAAAI